MHKLEVDHIFFWIQLRFAQACYVIVYVIRSTDSIARQSRDIAR